MALPSKPKTNISAQKNILIGFGIGGAAAILTNIYATLYKINIDIADKPAE